MKKHVVGVGNRLDQIVACLLRRLQQLGGNLFHRVLRAHRLVEPQNRLHRDQVDHAQKLRLRADLNVDRHRARAQPVDDGRRGVDRVRAGLVHLVDEADARDLVLVGLAPYRLGLGLHARDRVETCNRAVQHAQAALHLGGEVNVPRRVDDVDAMVQPGAGRRRGCDRDAALLLLLHPIHGRSSLMHLADTVRDARIEQDALGRRRLSGVDVSHDPDVPAMVQSYSACHGVYLSRCKACLACRSKLISSRPGLLLPVPCCCSPSYQR